MLRDTESTVVFLNSQPADEKRVAAVYRCKVQFEQLSETGHADIRFCDKCQQRVFKVTDFDGFAQAVAAKGCVWGPINPGKTAEVNHGHFLGGPVLLYASPSALQWED